MKKILKRKGGSYMLLSCLLNSPRFIFDGCCYECLRHCLKFNKPCILDHFNIHLDDKNLKIKECDNKSAFR